MPWAVGEKNRWADVKSQSESGEHLLYLEANSMLDQVGNLRFPTNYTPRHPIESVWRFSIRPSSRFKKSLGNRPRITSRKNRPSLRERTILRRAKADNYSRPAP